MSARLCAVLAVALAASPAMAQEAAPTLQTQVEQVLASAPEGTRFGLLVVDDAGHILVAVNPDQRFIPASNTKMFTTATAFATLPDVNQPDPNGGTGVRLEADGRRVPDVVLVGRGDARLSSAADCVTDCLATLADAVAARTKIVRDVIGDDSWYPDERWSPGMSWNNIPTRSGTGISALTLDDNEIAVTATPGAIGAPPVIHVSPYYSVASRAVTTPGGKTTIAYDRDPEGFVLRVTGTIAAGAAPDRDRIGIDDPARYAAWTLRRMLIARGVTVTGGVRVRHRLLVPADDPAVRGGAPAARPPEAPLLARITPPPLGEDFTIINKQSQNLHAELMLRRVSRLSGSGSIADGEAVLRGVMATAGVPRAGFDFSDGSGMSTYNRVSPRAAVTLLRWIAVQPWGAEWRATLPVGGVDGTLGRRFHGTGLDGKLFAKTGSLNATSALSGYMIAASGRTLTFSLYANDIPDGASATHAMDTALELIAGQE